MAIVNFVKCLRTQTVGGLNGVLNYCCQKAKIDYEGRPLVSGINCVPAVALQEFMNTKRLHKQVGGRMYYHMIQSFHPDENLTPETAHEIALKLAEQMPGFEIVVATHCDTDHIHSHFVINSVSCDTGKKYHSNMESLNALRQASDKLCLEYGLSVVTPRNKERPMPNREYRAYEKGQSWKLKLEQCIDECMTLARDRSNFFKLMEYSGYGVKWTADRKYITYTTPEGHRCRDIKLNGRKYHKEVMEYEFSIRKEICRANAAGAERYDPGSRSGAAHGSRDGTQLESDDRLPESAGGNAERDLGIPGTADHRRRAGGVHGAADGDPEAARGGFHSDHGAVPGSDDDISREHRTDAEEVGGGIRKTGWEHEREIWAGNFRAEAARDQADQAYFLARATPQLDPTDIGTDIAYLIGDAYNIIDDDDEVEDCTTIPDRPERKNTRGPVMGGM